MAVWESVACRNIVREGHRVGYSSRLVLAMKYVAAR